MHIALATSKKKNNCSWLDPLNSVISLLKTSNEIIRKMSPFCTDHSDKNWRMVRYKWERSHSNYILQWRDSLTTQTAEFRFSWNILSAMQFVCGRLRCYEKTNYWALCRLFLTKTHVRSHSIEWRKFLLVYK